jgi:hypothetical protein
VKGVPEVTVPKIREGNEQDTKESVRACRTVGEASSSLKDAVEHAGFVSCELEAKTRCSLFIYPPCSLLLSGLLATNDGIMEPSVPSSSGSAIVMDNDWEYLHGRLNPGQDESVFLVESVDVKEAEREDLHRRNDLLTSDEQDKSAAEGSKAPIDQGMKMFLLSNFMTMPYVCCILLSTIR